MNNKLYISGGGQTKEYVCKTTHTSQPFLNVNSGYLDLTTNSTSGLQLNVKYNNQIYRPVQTYTSTSSRSSQYTSTSGYSCKTSTKSIQWSGSTGRHMQFSETATSYVYGSGTFRSYSFKTTMLVSGTITSSTSQFTLAIAQSSISATTSTLTYGATSRPQSITINITKSTAKDVRGAQYLILSANRMTYKYCIDSYYTTVNNYFTSLNAGTYNSTTALTKTASRSSLYSTITEI